MLDLESWAPRVLSLLRVIFALLYVEHGLMLIAQFPAPEPGHHLLTPLILASGYIATVGGALIASIDPASPATQGGLKPGDVILTYDSKPVDRSRQLPRLVADSAPNKPVSIAASAQNIAACSTRTWRCS